MNEELKKLLVSMGLKADASDDEALRFAEEHGIRIITRTDNKAQSPKGEDKTAPAVDQSRAIELMRTAVKYDCVDEVSQMLRENKSDADILGWILEKKYKAEPVATAEIGLSEKDKRKYSFVRAILAKRDNNWNLAPFEKEVSDATAKHMRQNTNGFMIPMDILAYDLGVKTGEVKAVRDQVVGTAASGGNLVATELLVGDFIDMLKKRMVLNQLGVRWLTGLVGNIAIPRQTGGASYYFVAEQGNTTGSTATFDQVLMSPKSVSAKMVYSRLFLLQSSLGVEQFVRSCIADGIAEGIEYGILLGTGTNNQPKGLLNMTGLNSIAIGDNGGPLTGDHIVQFETEVSDDEVNDDGTMAYLANARIRGKLKRTQVFTGTNGMPLWSAAPGQRGVGDLNGYPALVSSLLPKDGTKGSGTNLSTMLFGKWSDLLIGLWGALDVLVDPYSGSDSGDTKVVGFQSFDGNVRHLESFCKCTDISTT